MNGQATDLDEVISAQRARLLKKEGTQVAVEPPKLDVAGAAAAPEAKSLYELHVVVRDDGTATVNVPDSKDQFIQLATLALAAAIERSAKAGYNIGAEVAVSELIANPNTSPVSWFRKTFGRDPTRKADQQKAQT